MAAVKPAGKPGLEEDAAPIHRIRITLTSRNTAALEKGAAASMHSLSGRCAPPTAVARLALAVRCVVSSIVVCAGTDGVPSPLAVSADLIRGAKDKHLKVKGPVRLPTKVRGLPLPGTLPWAVHDHAADMCRACRTASCALLLPADAAHHHPEVAVR